MSAGGVTAGRASYEPGWRWSQPVGAEAGEAFCQVEHVVLVVSGRMMVAMEDGREAEAGPGDLCALPPGRDARVLGDEPYVSLHVHGTEECAGHGGSRRAPDTTEAAPPLVRLRHVAPDLHAFE